MNEAQVLGLAASITVSVLGGFAAITFWLIRSGWERMDKTIEAERNAREEGLKGYTEMFLRSFTEERKARDEFIERLEQNRAQDRHDMRDEIAAVHNRLAAHELYSAREYVSYPRLKEELAPVVRGIERLFEKLDTKADKPGAGGN
jgi:uncharacterized membrane protein YccC